VERLVAARKAAEEEDDGPSRPGRRSFPGGRGRS
jgi:hypothetical protein